MRKLAQVLHAQTILDAYLGRVMHDAVYMRQPCATGSIQLVGVF